MWHSWRARRASGKSLGYHRQLVDTNILVYCVFVVVHVFASFVLLVGTLVRTSVGTPGKNLGRNTLFGQEQLVGTLILLLGAKEERGGGIEKVHKRRISPEL